MIHDQWAKTLDGMNVSVGVRAAILDCAQRLDDADDARSSAQLHAQLRQWVKAAYKEHAEYSAPVAGGVASSLADLL